MIPPFIETTACKRITTADDWLIFFLLTSAFLMQFLMQSRWTPVTEQCCITNGIAFSGWHLH